MKTEISVGTLVDSVGTLAGSTATDTEVAKTEMTRKELIISFLNDELKPGQIWESNFSSRQIKVRNAFLVWRDTNESVEVSYINLNEIWKLKQEWKPCTWSEAAKAKAEGKTVKCEHCTCEDFSISIYENYYFTDRNNLAPARDEMQHGKWYIKC